jgi:dinuclear metal center YbgI/SA1388 family protein
MLIGNIISAIESFAPPALQEEWDNTGMQIGSRRWECTGVMLCVDVTKEVIGEALDKNCNLIISHHPLFFKGVKRLTGSSLTEDLAMMAVKSGLSIYSAHTSLDSAYGGVSYNMAQKIGARPISVLQPLTDHALKLTVYAERARAAEVTDAILDAGAGDYGAVQQACAAGEITATTLGPTQPKGPAKYGNVPFMMSHTPLTRIETHVAAWRRNDIEEALSDLNLVTHLSYEFQPMTTADPKLGLGISAVFDEPQPIEQLIERIKKAFNSPIVRTTYRGQDIQPISRIAMCGGSGGEFIPTAIRRGAQVFLSSDIKYHDFLTYGEYINIVDIGHFESESCTKDIFYQIITEKFPNFAVHYSKLETNPINYL